MAPVKYFAYGSNMSPARLRERIGLAECLGVHYLGGFDLRFHKVGQDGTAKCDAYRTGDPSNLVQGVVFRIDPGQLVSLDSIEGVGKGYDRRKVEVVSSGGAAVSAFTYVASHLDASLLPFSWYKQHVLVGAKAAGLSLDYIERIERVPELEDPDAKRRGRELRIYKR